MLDRMVGDLIRNTGRRIQESCIATLEDVRRLPKRLVSLSTEVEEERRATKSFLYEHLYFSPSLSDEKDDAEMVVASLFRYWMDRPTDLPHQYQEKAEQEPLPRVICDYIAGMTDHFIYEQYDKFCAR